MSLPQLREQNLILGNLPLLTTIFLYNSILTLLTTPPSTHYNPLYSLQYPSPHNKAPLQSPSTFYYLPLLTIISTTHYNPPLFTKFPLYSLQFSFTDRPPLRLKEEKEWEAAALSLGQLSQVREQLFLSNNYF